MRKFKIKDPVSAATHFAGFLISIPVMICLILKSIEEASPIHVVAFTVFGISLLLLYGASTIYHTMDVKKETEVKLKRIDHMMIFILIAGSYAPFCLITIGGKFGFTMFTVMTTIAILGIVFKLCWFNCPSWVDSAMYIGMGWAALFMIKPLSAILPGISLFWLVLGGIFYTIGGIIYATNSKKLKIGNWGFHEIFHIFILLGSLSHFICVYTYVI